MSGYVTRQFDRWARKEGVSDESLCKAIAEMEQGLVDAKLGGNLYKKRVAAPGRGKRGSYRTLAAFKPGDKAFFVYGFAKNERANINDKEVRALKAIANELLGYDARAIKRALDAGALRELRCNDE